MGAERSARHQGSAKLGLRRLPHPGFVLGYGLALAAAAVAAFGLGLWARNPSQQALANLDASVPVSAEVVHRDVSARGLGTGSVVPGHVVPVGPPPVEGIVQVVTGVGVALDQELAAPAYLASVNGNPLFAINLAIPLYRDLRLDDTGPDVASLRAALGQPAEGKVTAGVLDAVDRLYRQAGTPMPGGKGNDRFIRAHDFVPIPGPAFRVIAIAPVGAKVNAEAPVVRLQTSPNAVTLRLSMLDIDSVQAGTPVLVGTPQGEYPGTIASIGEFAQPDETHPTAGYDATITLDDPAIAAGLEAGQQASVNRATPGAESLAVPLQAIRQDGPATYVLLPAASEEAEPARVDVTVTGQADGYAAIVSEKLAVGDRVLVSD